MEHCKQNKAMKRQVYYFMRKFFTKMEYKWQILNSFSSELDFPLNFFLLTSCFKKKLNFP